MNVVTQDLFAAASDLEFASSGGTVDPRTFAEHATALRAIAGASGHVLSAAKAFRDADEALKAHIAGRRDATTLPDKAWRAERIRLTEEVARTRIALHAAAVK